MELPLHFENYHKIAFFTGAGLSAESGIPTYRGQGGIWDQYNYEEYASQTAFERNPEKVWDFHDLRREKVAACQPNRGHQVIAEVQEAKPATRIITQNTDGMHQRAGAREVIELHGSLWRIRCPATGDVQENFEVPLENRQCAPGVYWRPDVVWFGDPMKTAELEAAERALEECDLLVSVGTSGIVFPAADLPRIAASRGVPTVEINLEDTPVTPLYQHRLRGKASELLEALWTG